LAPLMTGLHFELEADKRVRLRRSVAMEATIN
jgi:hypothetical protein